MMAIQLKESVPALCNNKECDEYRHFRLVDIEEIEHDEDGDFVYCDECQVKIRIPD